MRVLIDCDVLLDVVLKREPHFKASAAVLDWAEKNPGHGALAWHTIANLSYLGQSNALPMIKDLSRFLEVAKTDNASLYFALQLKLSDFEDAMQVAAAKAFSAQVICTRNLKHYRASPIRALSPADLLKLFT